MMLLQNGPNRTSGFPSAVANAVPSSPHKNNQYEGAKPVQYAIDYALNTDLEKAKELSYAKGRKCNHDREYWLHDHETYLGGKW